MPMADSCATTAIECSGRTFIRFHFLFVWILLKSDEFSSVFLRRLRFEDGRRPIAL